MFCAKCGNELKSDASFCHGCGQKVQLKEVVEKPSVSIQNPTPKVVEMKVTSPRNKKIGLYWLIGPWVLLISIIVIYAIASFVVTSLISSGSGIGTTSALKTGADLRITIASIIRTLMGLVGIVSVIGIMIGIPMGIIYLTKKESSGDTSSDERSGRGAESVIPDEIKGWNWGAAGLGWIWGIYHNVWISFLAFIPYFGLIWWIVMGLKGNEWAWRKNQYRNVEEFKVSQNKWKVWGIVFFIISILAVFANLSVVAFK